MLVRALNSAGGGGTTHVEACYCLTSFTYLNSTIVSNDGTFTLATYGTGSSYVITIIKKCTVRIRTYGGSVTETVASVGQTFTLSNYQTALLIDDQ